jgi:hypothetical protein
VYEETERFEKLSEFLVLEIQSVFSIYLIQDTLYSIKIVGDDDVVKNVTATITENTLKLKNHSKKQWLNPENNKVKIFISSPTLHAIWAKETYSLESVNTIVTNSLTVINYPNVKVSEIHLDLDCGTFFYWNNWLAGGHLSLTGKSHHLDINSYALHTVNTAGLKAANAVINLFSKSDCEIRVSDKLEYSIHSTGNIYLYGNPSEVIQIERTSTGKLIKAD